MKITHDFLVRLVNALNKDEYETKDQHIMPFRPFNSYTAARDRLPKEEIQPQLDKCIEKLRDPDGPKNAHDLVMSIIESTVIGVDDEGQEIRRSRPFACEEEWWACLTFQLDLVYLADEVDLSKPPAPEDISERLFVDSPAWSLNQEIRTELAERALRFLGNPTDVTAKNIFLIDGSVARIRFNNRELSPLKVLKGIMYLAYLIEHQGERFGSPLELHYALNPSESAHKKDDRQDITVNAHESGFQSSGRQTIDQNDVDKQLQKYHTQILEHQQKQEEAEALGDVKSYDAYEKNIALLTKEAKALKVRRKRKTEWDKPNKRAKNAMWETVKYAIKSIKADPAGTEVAQHFLQAFKPFDFPFSYDPHPSPNWNRDSV